MNDCSFPKNPFLHVKILTFFAAHISQFIILKTNRT